ncbi:SAM-dependent methyltransferase [Pyrobaculum calidifontis]|uniref:uroporphyrinogen-III C-methyltransferase n=1 Tax=Pyrobaculum calidifontis (strain DSM 21063 / JCM 11548 / VA1) TaxID=410359 RepID=A3MW43_PYRCJ|nr:SAM-dependent methyltransferase [Pyrobaculum calidifontis]ABO08860.1 Uroporphyrin-III C/tetrapyrrole (Corrin/Porphyrin) methyltransferase [Pyrobaculum calidifontis JCM 11548]
MLYIVGVGPGDKELLTLKAVKILQRADVVAYGDLVPEEVVEEFAPQAERVKIGHRHKDHDEVVARLLEVAREKNVVLLKNGDPTVFGRAHQICRMARAAGVPCEIVPGVSSFTAASALGGVELTDGVALRHVALLSYPHVDEEVLKSVRADVYVIFMMGDRLSQVAELVKKVCGKAVEVYVCSRISLGGTCLPLEKVEKVEKPLLVIVRKCWSPP